MMCEELRIKAKQAKSAEALLAMAKENGIEMNAESAAAYFAQMHKTGELADNELDNVSGGGCYHDDRLVVTVGYSCEHWRCEKCGLPSNTYNLEMGHRHVCEGKNVAVSCDCNHCKYCSYEDALWLCNHSAKRR